jgi:hypothetical protein
MSAMILKLRLMVVFLAVSALGQSSSVRAPSNVVAGSSFSITTTGSGGGTFYLLGPNHVLKQALQLGQELQISGADIPASGWYQAIACDSGGCANTAFYVRPATPARLSFLLHPSRVPVSAANAINATALVFDRFQNTVLAPTPVEFHFSPAGAASYSRSQSTNRGIAWLQMGSSAKQGPLKIVASVGETAEPRVIQQVASEACGLRMTEASSARNVRVQTDPIRDCSGNPLPDGTIVSFTKIDRSGRSTVDTPIKKGIATAQFSVSGPARISLACGVVLGNEISVGGRP